MDDVRKILCPKQKTMKQLKKYKANRIVDENKAYKIISEKSLSNSGVITKAYIYNQIIFLSTNSLLLIEELGKVFPNVFNPSDNSPPPNSEVFFINE